MRCSGALVEGIEFSGQGAVLQDKITCRISSVARSKKCASERGILSVYCRA